MKVLAIVPARSGSKSIPHKNIQSFRGKPLLVHSIDHGLAARNVDRVLVSTDSPAYREIALAAGAEAPFLRPAEISGDQATDLEVFRHALDWLLENEGYRPDALVHLRPTYPTRRVQDVEAAIELLASDPSAESVRSVSVAPHTPYKMWRLKGGLLEPLLSGPPREAWNLPRQSLPEVFIQNAAVDVVRTEVVVETGSMTGSRIVPYRMDGFEDLDHWSEFERAEKEKPWGDLPTGLTLAFDLDGVIATLVPDNDYLRAEPYAPAVALVNRLRDAGNRIVIYTARGSKTGENWKDVTREQLSRWGVRHDELRFGKPAADFYVDDRMISLATLLSWSQAGLDRRPTA
jgi:CMP-N-acetylneuraminic acid synthetase